MGYFDKHLLTPLFIMSMLASGISAGLSVVYPQVVHPLYPAVLICITLVVAVRLKRYRQRSEPVPWSETDLEQIRQVHKNGIKMVLCFWLEFTVIILVVVEILMELWN